MLSTLSRYFLLATACLSAVPAMSQSTQTDISARVMAGQLYLRGFWTDDKLQFDADGQPKKAYKTGSFTVGGFDHASVSLSGSKLKIDGERFGILFTHEGVPQKYPMKEKIHIEIEGNPGGDFGKALDAIFARNLAELTPSLPSYWQSFASHHFSDQAGETAAKSDAPKTEHKVTGNSQDGTTHTGGSVTPPKVLYSVEPSYTPAAQMLKMRGNVQVFLWVETDGTPSHLSIVKPMGLGLDDAAIEAVSKYKFRPSTQDGKPVKVDLYINVNFQIF